MNKIVIILTTLVLMVSTMACCCTFPATININGRPTVEVGEIHEDKESVPLVKRRRSLSTSSLAQASWR